MNRTLRVPALIVLPLLLVAGLVIQSRDDGPSAPSVRLSSSRPPRPVRHAQQHLVLRRRLGHRRHVGRRRRPRRAGVAIANASDTDRSAPSPCSRRGRRPRRCRSRCRPTAASS